MNFQEFDDWDSNFLDEAIRAEQEIISSRNPTQHQQQQKQKQSSFYHHHQPLHHHLPAVAPPSSSSSSFIHSFTFSPPRELSQKPVIENRNFNVEVIPIPIALETQPRNPNVQITTVEEEVDGEESEVDRLKRELGNVTEQLSHLEKEHAELKKDRDDKEKQLKSVTSQNKGKDKMRNNDIQNERTITADSRHHSLTDNALMTSFDRTTENITLPQTTMQLKCTRSTAVQTDCSESQDTGLCSQNDLSNDLLDIWVTPSIKRSGRDVVPKLLVTCASDFYILFRCMNMGLPSKVSLEFLSDERVSDAVLHRHIQSAQSVEDAKVTRLYLVLTKVNKGLEHLDTLLEALLELCSLENVVVVHRSLCIVNAVLQHILSAGSRSGVRDNIIVEGISLKEKLVESHKSERVQTGVHFGVSETGTSGRRSFDMNTLCNKEHKLLDPVTPILFPNWGSILQVMDRTAKRITVECVQAEAISIMNLILMRSNPCLEIVEYWEQLLFESVPQLLQKGVGSLVHKQALRLLLRLLNCPKLLRKFCTSCQEDREGVGSAADGGKNASAYRGFCSILKELASLLQCKDNNIEALKLRKQAIIVFAFVASSGKSGFEVLLTTELSKGVYFLGLLIQALAWEMDAESVEQSEIFGERISLIREALILVNRLASNPVYSATVLRVLTSSRDMTNLTIDVANRISRKGRGSWLSKTSNQARVEEVIDLSRVFRSRVYAYLGDTSS